MGTMTMRDEAYIRYNREIHCGDFELFSGWLFVVFRLLFVFGLLGLLVVFGFFVVFGLKFRLVLGVRTRERTNNRGHITSSSHRFVSMAIGL